MAGLVSRVSMAGLVSRVIVRERKGERERERDREQCTNLISKTYR